MKRRLDLLLVERGLAPSRRTAQALIMGGRVAVGGRREEKAGARVEPDADLSVAGPALPYVSRGGVKLAGALEAFAIEVSGLTAIDVGASTGGFTDCLLQRRAARVFAVDVGRGQLDWKLRNDPRVVVVEGINARDLSPGDLPALGDGAGIVTCDLAFISLRLVLPRLPPLLAPPGGPIVALVKPQFEVGRGKVGRGGIVRSPELRREALEGIARCALSLGLGVRGLARSPLAGAEGNVEYFMHLSTRPGGLEPAEIERDALRLTSEEPVDG